MAEPMEIAWLFLKDDFRDIQQDPGMARNLQQAQATRNVVMGVEDASGRNPPLISHGDLDRWDMEAMIEELNRRNLQQSISQEAPGVFVDRGYGAEQRAAAEGDYSDDVPGPVFVGQKNEYGE